MSIQMTVSDLIEIARKDGEVKWLEEAWDTIARQERAGGENNKKLSKLFEKRRKEIILAYLGKREIFGSSKLEAFMEHYKD